MDRLPTPVFLGFPGGSDNKESICSAADLGLIPGLGRSPGGGHSYPPQYSFLENPCGQRSLVDYSPWDFKELDVTECSSTHITQIRKKMFFLNKDTGSIVYPYGKNNLDILLHITYKNQYHIRRQIYVS